MSFSPSLTRITTTHSTKLSNVRARSLCHWTHDSLCWELLGLWRQEGTHTLLWLSCVSGSRTLCVNGLLWSSIGGNLSGWGLSFRGRRSIGGRSIEASCWRSACLSFRGRRSIGGRSIEAPCWRSACLSFGSGCSIGGRSIEASCWRSACLSFGSGCSIGGRSIEASCWGSACRSSIGGGTVSGFRGSVSGPWCCVGGAGCRVGWGGTIIGRWCCVSCTWRTICSSGRSVGSGHRHWLHDCSRRVSSSWSCTIRSHLGYEMP